MQTFQPVINHMHIEFHTPHNAVREWLITHIRDQGYVRAEATAEAEARWTDHVRKMYAMMLMRKAKSWFTGYNSNVPGHEEGRVRYFVYNGGAPKYIARINEVAAKGYEGVMFRRDSEKPAAAAE